MGLILTVGLPQSGKTTWAKQQGLPIVNPDSIRLALHGKPYIQEAEGFVWAVAYLMARALLLAGHNWIIIDATNNTEKRRQEWINRFSKCEIILKRFDVPKDICIQRAMDNNRKDLVPIIEKMANDNEPNPEQK